jgi:hypothetical protein
MTQASASGSAACRAPASRAVRGVTLAITAFPVRARMLTARGRTRPAPAVVARGCAAIDAVTAWGLRAFIVGIARALVGAGLLVTAGARGDLAGRRRLARPLPRGTAAGGFVARLLCAPRRGQQHPGLLRRWPRRGGHAP